ncbi:hypothetical protein ACQ4PT_051615 [Festuca glaucescens]
MDAINPPPLPGQAAPRGPAAATASGSSVAAAATTEGAVVAAPPAAAAVGKRKQLRQHFVPAPPAGPTLPAAVAPAVPAKRVKRPSSKVSMMLYKRNISRPFCFAYVRKEEGPMIEEYAFSFSYPSKGEEVSMNLSRTGSKKNSATFKSNAEEVTPDQMRSSACKMIRTLVSLMRTLDQMPDERTILMKLLYYDDVTVKSVLDPCDANNVNSEDDNMSLGHESDQDDDSDTEVRPSEVDRYVVAPNDGNGKDQSGSISEEDTQDPAHEEAITAQVREWICSRDIVNVHASDVLSNFPDISMITDPKTWHIKKEVLVENVLSPEGPKSNNVDTMYMKALYHALPMDYVTIAKLQGKLDGEANLNTVRKLIDKMVQDGYVKNSGNQRLGKAVIHSEASNRKLIEIKKILEVDLGEELATDTNPGAAEFEHRDHPMTDQEMKDGSTNDCFHSVGSDLTRTRELPETEQNMSMQKDPSRTPTSMREPATSLESGVFGQRIRKSMTGGDVSQSTQHGKRTRKASMAKEPILQFVKRQQAPVQ